MTTGTVYLSEYNASMLRGVQVPKAPPLVVQTPIVASGVAQSFQTFQGDIVRLKVDSGGPVNVKWGTPPVAAVAGFDEHWSPGLGEYRTVTPGDTVSVIASTA
jgi:hypothetical protein